MKAKILTAVIFVAVLCSAAYAALPSVTVLLKKNSPECEKMLSVLRQIDSQYGTRIATSYIYLDEHPETAEEYKVRHIPMMIFWDADGKERAREIGPRTLEQVLAVFEKVGIKI
ncbi:MAG: thioredoxin family protein [Synergistaceae bacterium]|nr:thioredoxin family protein [Synergistaceae bacterium]